MEAVQEFYSGSGPMVAPIAEFGALPKGVAALRDVIQGVMIHSDIAPWLYDLKLSQHRQDDKHIRPVSRIVARIKELSDQPLTAARKPADRMACVCRHFSLMLCAMLRQQGVPARARAGFGSYFNQGKFEDHWVCEYWNQAESRWVLVDAQLDAVQRKAFRLDFDPLDVPRNRFIIAGDAWQMCRSGRANADDFGLSPAHMQGLWFIAGNVLRDLASLNRMEMLPWDVWGLMVLDDASLGEEARTLLDQVSALTLAGDEEFARMRTLYESDDRLRVPDTVFNALRNVPEKVAAQMRARSH